MTFRPYDPVMDLEAVRRIKSEVGWLTSNEQGRAHDVMMSIGSTWVAEVSGQPECFVQTGTGDLRYLEREIPFCGVFSVATGRVARRQGVAAKLTAHCVALDAAAGLLVAGLGMFDQGYYDKLGFGSGSYLHRMSFDPQSLVLPRHVRHRPPVRLDSEVHGEQMHLNRLARMRSHGSINFHNSAVTRGRLLLAPSGSFSLGYFDGPNGELTHHFMARLDGDVREGPYMISYLAYSTREQALELFSLIRSLGDQIKSVWFDEPPGVQIQDLISQPARRARTTAGSSFEHSQKCLGDWQVRINDIPRCVEYLSAPGRDELRFNLSIIDPIETLLPDDAPWRGTSGDYVLSIGENSRAQRGSDASLPTMTASINAFTRLWFGIRPASGLTITDTLEAPPDLIAAVDRKLRLPVPCTDWDF